MSRRELKITGLIVCESEQHFCPDCGFEFKNNEPRILAIEDGLVRCQTCHKNVYAGDVA